jgi:hypothetical protein
MALGFLGTLIAVERAVALDRAWVWVAPMGAGAGALVALADPGGALGPMLLVLAGAVLVAAHVAIDRRQRSLHNAVMAIGAVAWVAAAGWWLAGAEVARVTPLLAAFLVLTIVGERLELSRMGPAAHAGARPALLAGVATFAAGLALAAPAPGAGLRLAGAGLLMQALWLARHDIARRTVRIGGVTRYMAVALLAGYGWLAVGGAIWLAYGATLDTAAYDAALHSVFLGFVMSMVFAHAPVIVPAVLRVAVPYRRRFVIHLALLHASLLLRVLGGDLLGDARLWQWGGALNETAIVLFLLSTAAAVAAARRGGARRPRTIKELA